MSRKLDPEIREKVRQRSNYLCEYCHANERWQCVEFTIDHIDPHAGDELENLALACFHCNRRKSNKTNSIDPTTQEIAKLFDPRSQRWNDHFEWSEDGLLIQAKTSIGRATLDLLELNRSRIIRIREADILAHRHPPAEDR